MQLSAAASPLIYAMHARRSSASALGTPAAASCTRRRCAVAARMRCSSTVLSLPPLKLNATPRVLQSVLRKREAGGRRGGRQRTLAAATAAPDCSMRLAAFCAYFVDRSDLCRSLPVQIQRPQHHSHRLEAPRLQARVFAVFNSIQHIHVGWAPDVVAQRLARRQGKAATKTSALVAS